MGAKTDLDSLGQRVRRPVAGRCRAATLARGVIKMS